MCPEKDKQIFTDKVGIGCDENNFKQGNIASSVIGQSYEII
jgi:hypothetical protein